MAPSIERSEQPKSASTSVSNVRWETDTELVGLVFELISHGANSLYPQYAIGLHAWFLAQVQQYDPALSKLLHDSQSEKAFTISRLEGELLWSNQQLRLIPQQTYYWHVSALSQPVAQFLQTWMQQLPATIELNHAPLVIRRCAIALPPTTYRRLWESKPAFSTLKLSFVTPTSFRRHQHHFPLPVPTNIFHSYLRRWNDFSQIPFDQETFLPWVDENVIIYRHQIESHKVVAGKRGMVTGFTGAVEFGLGKNQDSSEFQQLFYTLGQLAPYCGTGHKTTFGLGQTRLGWELESKTTITTSIDQILADRITELTEFFLARKTRTGNLRLPEMTQTAETRAIILARRELGESLSAIATDLEMPYETVKTYAKIARRELQQG